MIALHQRDLHHWFDTVFRPRRLLGKSPETIRLYRQFIDRFGDFLERRGTLDDLNEDAACAFLQSRLEAGLSAYTVAKERAELISLSAYAARKRFIPEFLDVPQISMPELNPEAYKLDQLKLLFDTCATMPGMIGTAKACDWWIGLHYVFLFTGERTAATLSLKWDWLDWATGWLAVPATVRKGRRKAKRYLLPEIVLAKLRPLLGVTEEFIFANPWSRDHKSGAFYYRYTRLLKRAGLPHGSKWKPQKMRRTFASYLEAAGGDATEAFDHESRRTTKRSYLDVSICGPKAPSQFLGGVFNLG